jgi:hypothetical protein
MATKTHQSHAHLCALSQCLGQHPDLGFMPFHAFAPAKPCRRPLRIRTNPNIPIKLNNKIIAHSLKVGMGAFSVPRISAKCACT